MPHRRRWPAAALAGLAVLTVYLRTLAPGLIAITDTPKFQFVGRVLGTAHNPGYPLYVVVSHLFGLLPIGTLAWRINLLSALFGAAAVCLFVGAATELGTSSLVAAAAGVALGLGSAFWLSATIAEVYTLHVMLVAAMTLVLLRWRSSRRAAYFFGAIAIFSLGLGHHTTIVLVGPAVGIFAVLVNRRFALNPKTLGAIVLLFVLGFSQYLFVLVRTRQGAWGESPASNLTELAGVIRGAQFTGAVAPITWATFSSRAPLIVRVLVEQISLAGAVAALVGLVGLWRRDRPVAVLALLAIVGDALFGTFYGVGDIDQFLLPACFFAWLLGAVGGELAFRLLMRRDRIASITAFAGAVSIAVFLYQHNLSARDLSHHRFELRYFDALFAQLPPRSALLNEDFLVDRMVLYKTLGEDAARPRDLVAPSSAAHANVNALLASGRQVFAFEQVADDLRMHDAANVDYAPLPLVHGPLRRYIDDQPPGSLVVMAIPALHAAEAFAHDAVPLDRIGAHPATPEHDSLVAIGVVGTRDAAVQAEDARGPVSVGIVRGARIGARGPAARVDVVARAQFDRASIHVGSRELIHSSVAPVVAVWSPEGAFVQAFALDANDQVPLDPGPLRVHQVHALDAWSRSAGPSQRSLDDALASGHVWLEIPPENRQLIMYAAAATPLAPELFEFSGPRPTIQASEFSNDGAAVAAAMEHDAWLPAPAMLKASHVVRVVLNAPGQSVHLGFGGIPDAVEVKSRDGFKSRAIDFAGQLERIDARTERLHVARDHHRFFFGAGWSPVATDAEGAFRISTASRSMLLLPRANADPFVVDVQARSADGKASRVDLLMNGNSLGPSQAISGAWGRYQWTVPRDAAHAGTNAAQIRGGNVVIGDVLIETAAGR